MCRTSVEQKELSGTASAIAAALPSVPEEAEAILVLYGDHPFIQPESIQKMATLFFEERPAIVQSFLAVEDFNNEREIFTAFGRLVRDAKGKLTRIDALGINSPEDAQRVESLLAMQ